MALYVQYKTRKLREGGDCDVIVDSQITMSW